MKTLSLLALVMTIFKPAAPAQTSDAVFYVTTYVDVQPSSTNQGIFLIAQYREASRKETGNLGVDVVQEIGRTNRFVIASARLATKPGVYGPTSSPARR